MDTKLCTPRVGIIFPDTIGTAPMTFNRRNITIVSEILLFLKFIALKIAEALHVGFHGRNFHRMRRE
jgi:hypothetical protein